MVAADYAATAIKKATIILGGLASVVLLARYLGPELRAEYAVILNSVAILLVILNFGLNGTYQNARREYGAAVIKSFVTLTFIIALSIAGIAVSLLPFGLPKFFAIGMLSAIGVLRLHLQTFRFIEDIRGDAFTVASVQLFYVATIFLLYIFAPASLPFALAAYFLKEAATALLSFAWIKGSREKANVSSIRAFTRFWIASTSAFSALKNGKARINFILSVLIILNYKINVIILYFLEVDPYIIGIFAVGVAIAEYLWVFADIFKDVQIKQSARGGGASGAASANRLALSGTLLIYGAFAVFGSFAVRAALGEDFAGTYQIAFMMLIANFFMIPPKILGSYLISIGHVDAYALAIFGSNLVNIALSLLLIPHFGVYGSILSCIAAYGLAGLAVIWIFVSHTDLKLSSVLVLKRSDLIAFGSFFGLRRPQ